MEPIPAFATVLALGFLVAAVFAGLLVERYSPYERLITVTLEVNREGDLFLVTDDRDGNREWNLLGPIADAADSVPRELWDQYDRLWQDWRDALAAGAGYRDTVSAAYDRAMGGVR